MVLHCLWKFARPCKSQEYGAKRASAKGWNCFFSRCQCQRCTSVDDTRRFSCLCGGWPGWCEGNLWYPALISICWRVTGVGRTCICHKSFTQTTVTRLQIFCPWISCERFTHVYVCYAVFVFGVDMLVDGVGGHRGRLGVLGDVGRRYALTQQIRAWQGIACRWMDHIFVVCVARRSWRRLSWWRLKSYFGSIRNH